MAVTDAQKRATNKYRSKFDELRFRVTPEEKEMIKTYCDEHNVSVSEFVKKIVLDNIK